MKIGFIGCGNMGGALAVACSGDGREILLYDKNEDSAAALAKKINGSAVTDLSFIARESEIIFLGVKPSVIPAVLCELKGKLDSGSDTLIVSMAAGVSTEMIESGTEKDLPVIRIMPNTPVAVGAGMIAWCAGKHVSTKDERTFLKAMKNAGTLDNIDEGLIDAETAVAGCGPAFAYMFVEALAKGGVECGLSRDKAILYAAAMLEGAAKTVIETGKSPEQLKKEVCSPGGSTIEGVYALEEGAFTETVMSAVIASYEKTKKLGK